MFAQERMGDVARIKEKIMDNTKSNKHTKNSEETKEKTITKELALKLEEKIQDTIAKKLSEK